MIRTFCCTGTDQVTGAEAQHFLLLPVHREENRTRELSLQEIQQRLPGSSFIISEFREDPAYSALVNKIFYAALVRNNTDIRGTIELVTNLLDGALELSREDTEIPPCIDRILETA